MITAETVPGIGTWTLEVVSARVYADAVTARMFGLTATQGRSGLPLTPYINAIEPQDRERMRSRIASAIKSGEQFRETYAVRDRDGAVRDVLASGRCFRSPDGLPSIFSGLLVDVTGGPLGREARERNILDALLSAARDGQDMLHYLLSMAYQQAREDAESTAPRSRRPA